MRKLEPYEQQFIELIAKGLKQAKSKEEAETPPRRKESGVSARTRKASGKPGM